MIKIQKLTLTDELPLTCSRKGTCCHGNNVTLNPWELFQLAKRKGVSTRQFKNQYCDLGGIRLRFEGDKRFGNKPACSQYIDGFGCSVHEGRPLACRLFPLGRQKEGDNTFYMHQGKEFPCLNGCPEVIELPKLTVNEYLKGQSADVFENAHDAYLEVMEGLADIAFVFLLETPLIDSTTFRTLNYWKELSEFPPEDLAIKLGDWLDVLMVPALNCNEKDLASFVNEHNEMLQEKAQLSFGNTSDVKDLYKASGLMLGLALHLGRSLGVDTNSLVTLWINTAKEHGAIH